MVGLGSQGVHNRQALADTGLVTISRHGDQNLVFSRCAGVRVSAAEAYGVFRDLSEDLSRSHDDCGDSLQSVNALSPKGTE
jgi:hypothetical protein